LPTILKVSQLNRYVKSQIESDIKLREVYVAGEISSLSVNQRSGHIYFSLRDNESSVRAVMFSKNAEFLRFMPQNGIAVVARGAAALYERDGTFQLVVSELMPDGAAAYGFAYEKQKKLLEAKGYFEESRKRSIPIDPKTIGIVTSDSGAALHDIISVLEKKNPSVAVLLAAASVQGKEAPKSVAEAIELLNSDNRSEVIIVARGGGSAEDLWSFNDEMIVKAVFESHIPVISAVGHETDVTLCDLAADIRAATPTAAAHIAVSDINDKVRYLKRCSETLDCYANSIITEKESRLNSLASSEAFKSPEFFINKNRQRLNNLVSSLYNHSLNAFDKQYYELSKRAALLESLSPLKVLSRGYSVVSLEKKAIFSCEEVKPGDIVDLRFHRGFAKAQIIKTEKDQKI